MTTKGRKKTAAPVPGWLRRVERELSPARHAALRTGKNLRHKRGDVSGMIEQTPLQMCSGSDGGFC